MSTTTDRARIQHRRAQYMTAFSGYRYAREVDSSPEMIRLVENNRHLKLGPAYVYKKGSWELTKNTLSLYVEDGWVFTVGYRYCQDSMEPDDSWYATTPAEYAVVCDGTDRDDYGRYYHWRVDHYPSNGIPSTIGMKKDEKIALFSKEVVPSAVNTADQLKKRMDAFLKKTFLLYKTYVEKDGWLNAKYKLIHQDVVMTFEDNEVIVKMGPDQERRLSNTIKTDLADDRIHGDTVRELINELPDDAIDEESPQGRRILQDLEESQTYMKESEKTDTRYVLIYNSIYEADLIQGWLFEVKGTTVGALGQLRHQYTETNLELVKAEVVREMSKRHQQIDFSRVEKFHYEDDRAEKIILAWRNQGHHHADDV